MSNFITKNLKWIFTSSFAFVLAACYGTPVEMQKDVSILTVNEKNEPIPGLKVTLSNNGSIVSSEITNSSGELFYSSLNEGGTNNFKIVIEDTDGEQNLGKFKTTEVDIVQNQINYSVPMIKE